LTAVAGGCSRADARYTQSDGHRISVNRFVPQQTAQMSWPSAGHARRAFRFPQSGHVTRQLLRDLGIFQDSSFVSESGQHRNRSAENPLVSANV